MSKANPAFLYPPSHQKALRHRKANQIFKGLTPSDRECCECCNRKIGSSSVSPSCMMNPDQLSFLGPGIPLFFHYIRMTIILMLAMTLIFSTFSAYTNYNTNDCNNLKVCQDNLMNLLSLINKRSSQNYFKIQAYVQLGFIVMVIFFLQWMRLQGRKLERQCDEVIDSPSDYAVILRRLPPQTTETDILEMVEQRRATLTQQQRKTTQNLKIVKVILSYSLREYNRISQTNTESFKTAIKTNSHQKFTPQPQPQPTNPSYIAVIIFEHQSSKYFFIHKPTAIQRLTQAFCTPCVPISEHTVKGQPIGIERAPQPDDICWENSGITMTGGIGRKVLYGSLAFFILLLGAGAQYGLQVLYNSTSNSSLQTVLTISNSVVVLVFNSIIMLTLIITTKKERNETLTEYQSVLMTKQTIFQFFNAGLFVVGAEVAAQNNKFSLNDGLCMQISAIMLANCFVPSLTLILLNYTEIVNNFFIFLGEKGCMQYTQQELNELFLGPVVDLPSKYAYILKIVWLTGLYAPLVPLVSLVAVLGLCLNYLFEKILFTKSYSLPNTVSSQTYENALELLQYFGVTFAMGQLIAYLYFYSYEINKVPTVILVTIFLCLALGAINILLPMGAINQALFPLPDSAKSEVRYSSIEEKFEVTYEMNNPAYKTDRQRRNVKDILGLGIDEEETRAVAIEMTNLFIGTVGGNNAGNDSLQPLLKDGTAPPPVSNKKNEQNPSEIRQNQQGIFTAILKGQNKDKNKEKGENGQKNTQNQDYIFLLNDLLTDRTLQSNTNNPNMSHSGGPIPLNTSFQSFSGNDPRKQLKSIKRQLQNKSEPSNLQNNQSKAQQKPIPTSQNPPINKPSAPSATTANDSFFKRTITDRTPQKKQNYTQRKEVVEGETGEKFNISVLEPPQAKNPKKGPTKQLQINSDDTEPITVPAKATNSSTKYKKMPQVSIFIPEEKPQKEVIKPFQLPKKPQQQQKIAPYRNLHGQVPLAMKNPPQNIPESTEQVSSVLETDNGIYVPLVHSQQFKFNDPIKEKQSRYNPHLIDNSQDETAQGRSYLNSEGIMKAFGRPFTSFVKKVEEKEVDHNAKKKERRQGKANKRR